MRDHVSRESSNRVVLGDKPHGYEQKPARREQPT